MDNFEQPLNPEPNPYSLPAGARAAIGLAVASFVLGIVSLMLSLFVIGVIFGIAGLIIGIIRLASGRPYLRSLAIWGVVLCALGSIIATGFGIFYGIQFNKACKMMEERKIKDYAAYIGTASPDLKLTDTNGNKIVLSELKGKRVILDFWATWCPPCKKEIPHFVKLANKKDSNLVIIGISSETDLKDWVQKLGINYPIVLESNLPAPYNTIKSIPTTFFIDSKGIIKNVLVGYHDYKKIEAEALSGDYKGQIKEAPAETQANQIDQKTIEILKKRIDPNGTKNLVWRPKDGNRVEIVLPKSGAKDANKE